MSFFEKLISFCRIIFIGGIYFIGNERSSLAPEQKSFFLKGFEFHFPWFLELLVYFCIIAYYFLPIYYFIFSWFKKFYFNTGLSKKILAKIYFALEIIFFSVLVVFAYDSIRQAFFPEPTDPLFDNFYKRYAAIFEAGDVVEKKLILLNKMEALINLLMAFCTLYVILTFYKRYKVEKAVR